jgi:MOSC domain-containing protein YiiM
MEKGRLESINVSQGGVPKSAVPEAVVTTAGLSGDRQRDLHFHGGPDRAVTLFSLEKIRALRAEGHPIAPGTTGENLTVSGLDWDRLGPGARLRIGTVELVVTRYAAPCANIRGSFASGDFSRLSQKQHAGWSRLCARVAAPGTIRPGDSVEVVSEGGPA